MPNDDRKPLTASETARLHQLLQKLSDNTRDLHVQADAESLAHRVIHLER